MVIGRPMANMVTVTAGHLAMNVIGNANEVDHVAILEIVNDLPNRHTDNPIIMTIVSLLFQATFQYVEYPFR